MVTICSSVSTTHRPISSVYGIAEPLLPTERPGFTGHTQATNDCVSECSKSTSEIRMYRAVMLATIVHRNLTTGASRPPSEPLAETPLGLGVRIVGLGVRACVGLQHWVVGPHSTRYKPSRVSGCLKRGAMTSWVRQNKANDGVESRLQRPESPIESCELKAGFSPIESSGQEFGKKSRARTWILWPD